jgi:hypothetical protein
MYRSQNVAHLQYIFYQGFRRKSEESWMDGWEDLSAIWEA